MTYEHKPSDITCPYCEFSRDADTDDYNEDGHTETEECHNCGKEFIISVSISVSWDSTCTEENHEDDGYHRLNRIWCKHCHEIIGDDPSPEAAGHPRTDII